MSWVRVDDHFAEHTKILELGPLGPLAIAVQNRAWCWAARARTDGFLPVGAVPTFLTHFDSVSLTDTSGIAPNVLKQLLNQMVNQMPDQTVDRCLTVGCVLDLPWPTIMVEAGLWDEADGGYQIHDFLVYNPSRRATDGRRAMRQRVGRMGGRASAARREHAQAFGQPNGQPNASANGQQTSSKQDGKLQPPSPTPSPLTTDTEKKTGMGGPEGAAAPPAPPTRKPRNPQDLSMGPDLAGRFARFWAGYPRHDNKQEAIKAWKQSAPDELLLARMLVAIVTQRTWRQWLEGKIPHASTWLRGKRWEDEQPPEGRDDVGRPSPAAIAKDHALLRGLATFAGGGTRP